MIEYTSWDDPVIGLQVEPFNWRLRKARKARGWSRAALARAAGITPSVVGEAEKLRHVSASAREKMAFALEIPEDELFPGVIDQLPKDGPGTIEIPFTEHEVERWRETGSFSGPASLDALTDRLGVQEAWDRTATAVLTPRERRILEMRYGLRDGEARAHDEIAEQFGVSRERIRQLEGAGLRKLRSPMHRSALADAAGIQRDATPRRPDAPSPFVAFLHNQAKRANGLLPTPENRMAQLFLAQACCARERTSTGLRAHLRREHVDDPDLWRLFDQLTAQYRQSLQETPKAAAGGVA